MLTSRQDESRSAVLLGMKRDIEAARRERLTVAELERERGAAEPACLCGPGEAVCGCRLGAPARETSDRQVSEDCQEARATMRLRGEIRVANPTNFQMNLKAPALWGLDILLSEDFAGPHSADVAPGQANETADEAVVVQEPTARTDRQSARGRA